MNNTYLATVEHKTDEELLTMVYQFDEWNPDMLEAVEKELLRREMLPDDIATRKQEIIDSEAFYLEQGRPASLAGQIFGWLGVLGFIGLIIGYNYAFAKSKSKYTGKKYFKYDEASRENGNYIFYISLSVFIIYFLYKLGNVL